MGKNNPQLRRAIALAYGSTDELPEVTAQGIGKLADAILEFALEHEIPIHACKDLVRELSHTRSGNPIPPQTFRLVAEIMSFLYLVDDRWRSRHNFLEPIVGSPREDINPK